MTRWDLRLFLRALAATLVGLVVVWLVTAASDEGHLTMGARAGRTLPLTPLCGAVGAMLALATARVRDETRALEALGRSPAENALGAALGAALPSIVVALAIGLGDRIEITAFYPRGPRGDVFLYAADGRAFVSPTLGVRIGADGAATSIPAAPLPEDPLPRGARGSAALATAAAGAALGLLAARATLRVSLVSRESRRRRRAAASLLILGCTFATVLGFQAAAAHLVPPFAAAAPPLVLLALVFVGYLRRDGKHRPA